MTITLLQTKLFVPQIRAPLVPRPRLIEALSGGLSQKLTLVAAPAGYGKTTLISEFVNGNIRRIPYYLAQAETTSEKLAATGTLPADHPEYLYLNQQFRLLRSLLARLQGDGETAVREAAESLALLPEMEELLNADQLALGRGAINLQLGYGQLVAGNLASAASCFDLSYRDSRQAGNFLAMGAAVFELAHLWGREGRLGDAETLCREIVTLAERPDYADWPAFFIVHIALADVLRERGQTEEALGILEQGLDLGRQSGQIYYLAHGYLAAERLYQARGDGAAAETAVKKAEILLADIGLTSEKLKMLGGEGQDRPQISSGTAAVLETLTPREEDVLRLLAMGLSNREIAAELYLSLNTIKTHTKSLYSKLDVHNRTQAVVRTRELDLFS